MDGKIKAVGTRQEVYEGKARHTLGGLFKDDIILNSKGQYVSKKMSETIRARFIQVQRNTAAAAAVITDAADKHEHVEKTEDKHEHVEKAAAVITDPAAKLLGSKETIDGAFIRIRGYLPVRGAIRQFYNKIIQTAPNLPIDEMAHYIIAQAKADRVKL